MTCNTLRSAMFSLAFKRVKRVSESKRAYRFRSSTSVMKSAIVMEPWYNFLSLVELSSCFKILLYLCKNTFLALCHLKGHWRDFSVYFHYIAALSVMAIAKAINI